MYKNVNIYFSKENNELFNETDIFDIEFISFMLRRIGNIEDNRFIELKDNQCILCAVTSNINKLNQRIKRLNKTFINKFKIKLMIGNEMANSPEICTCENTDSYIIKPEYDFLANKSISSIIKCGKCNKDIPISSLDNLSSEDKAEIIKLQNCYNSMETLRLYEVDQENNTNNIEKHNSEINILAKKIKDNLEIKTKKKVYYYLNNPVDGVYKENKKCLKDCPNCNNKLKILSKENNVCHKCRLIFPNYI